MKTKLLAIVLSLLMLVQPVMAIGMVGMESTAEIAATIPEEVQEENQEAEIMSAATDVHPDNVVFFDDFEGNEVKDWGKGKYASYTFAYQNGETTVNLGSTDASSGTVDGVAYDSTRHWQIIEEEGDKVLYITQYAATHNNIGFDFNNVKISDPGVYTLSFDLKLELGENAEGFGASAGSDFTWFQHEKMTAAGTTSDEGVPANSGINGTNGNANLGNWFDVSYKYIVTANSDGTRSIKVQSNRNGWNPSAVTFSEGEYLSRIRHYFKMYPAKISQGKMYLDDIKLTYDAYTLVKYVDEAGNTLYIDNVAAANTASYTLATKATLGTDFYPAYFVNGNEIIANKYDISGLGTEVTVTVKPNARVYYEDFETGFTLGEALKVPRDADHKDTWTRAALNGAFRREDSATYVQSGDESINTDVTPNVYSNQQWTVVELEGGNKALKVTANKGMYDSAGFKIQKLDISKPGIYHLSFDVAEVEGSGGTWGDGQGSTEFGQPTLDGVVPAKDAFRRFDWTIVATVNADDAAKMDYVMTNNTSAAKKTYTGVSPVTSATQVVYFSVSTKTGNLELYADNFEFTYGQAVPVTFTDANGATIKSYTGAQGENLVLNSVTVGTKYAAKYIINGVNYDEGSIYKIPADATSLTVKVVKYTWADLPAEAPSNAIIYEDYNNVSTYTVGNEITYYDDEYFTHTTPTFGSYGGKKKMLTVNGRKVLSIYNEGGTYHGMRLSGIKLNKAGKYTIIHYAYIDSSRDGVAKIESTLNWYTPNDAKILSGTNANFYATEDKHNKYVAYTKDIVLTEADGKLYYDTTDITEGGVDNALWYMNWGSDGDRVYEYVDYSCITYNKAVKVNVYGIDGTLAQSYDVYQNDSITLPTLSNASFVYGNETYDSGAAFAVPADAASVIEINAIRNPMPNTVPANTVVYEDFEDKTVGATVSAKPAHYTTEEFDGTTVNQCEGATSSKTYEKAPDDENNTALKIVSTATYSNSLQVDLPDDIPAGKYNVSWKFYIDNDVKDTEDIDGDSNTTEYINSISAWCRFWYDSAKDGDDGYVGASVNRSFNNASDRKAWNTYSFDFEVFERDGKRYVQMYSADHNGTETHEITGNAYLKLHTTSSNPTVNSNTIYHDNLIITRIAPEEYTGYFVDGNGESIDYVGTYKGYDNGYVLPSAEDMGIDYLVEFEGADGNTYYPGMTYTIPGEEKEAEFVVRKTNVVLFENYKEAEANSEPLYKGGIAEDITLFTATHPAASNYTWKNKITGSTQGIFNGMKLDTPGVYTFSADCELEVVSGTVAGNVQVAFQHSTWDAMQTKIKLTKESPKTTIKGTLTVVEGEDGELYFYHSGNKTLKRISDQTPGNYHVFGMKVGFDISGYPADTADADKEHYTLHFSNLKVTFDGYAPVNTGKASYREMNADDQGGPEGIRFAAYASDYQRETATEYGFVVTRKSLLTTEGVTDYTKLNLKGIDAVSATVTTSGKNSDGIAIVAAAAYNGTVDRIYVQDGKVFGFQGLYDTFFTAVLYGLDTDVRKAEVFVARPYAKVDGVYYYGDCHETSFNDVKAAAEAANA